MEQHHPAHFLHPISAVPPPLAAANPSPTTTPPPPPPLSHPSYSEMITAAIRWDSSQGKEGGSSKRAIAKYIDRVYSNLPPSHSALLTHHLKRLKNSGQLVMFKNSYMLSSSPTPPLTGSAPPQQPQQQPTNPTPTPKRRGRPPKLASAQPTQQAQPISPAQPNGTQSGKKRGRPPKVNPQQQQQLEGGNLEEHQIMMAAAEVPFIQPISEQQQQHQAQPIVYQAQPISEAHPTPLNGGQSSQKRRPGRPPKQQPVVTQPVFEGGEQILGSPNSENGVAVGTDSGVKRRPGRPRKSDSNVAGGSTGPVVGGGYSGKPRGRPKTKKAGMGVGLGPLSRAVGVGKRPRGRPRKEGGGSGAVAAAVGVVLGKRRGRPPGKPMRRSSGKPLGRPRKYPVIPSQNTSEQARTNEELMRRLELIQLKVRDAVAVIRPYVVSEFAALTALQQLEELVTPQATASPTAPPMEATPMSVMAPPPSESVLPTGTAPPTVTVTAPVMNPPAFTMTGPFQAPFGSENQQPMRWVPSDEAQS